MEADWTMTEEQEAAMFKAMQNHLIVDKICQHLQFHELRACRLVSKIFTETSSKWLHRRDFCALRFSFNSKTDQFRHITLAEIEEEHRAQSQKVQVIYDRDRSLSAFNDILERSTFPLLCTNLTFQDGSLGDSQVQRFFDIAGPFVRNLKLWCHTEEDHEHVTSKAAFSEILAKTTRLENLRMKFFDFEWTREESLNLPSLKLIAFNYGRWETTLKILQSTPSAIAVDNLSLDDCDLLIKLNKIIQINSVGISCDDSIQNIIKFSNSNARLKRLSIALKDPHLHDNWLMESQQGHFFYHFARLLESLKYCLESLELGEFVKHFPQLKFPPFSNLRSLKLKKSEDGARLLQMGINLEKTFPNLHTLDCTEGHLPRDEVAGILLSVQNLKIETNVKEVELLFLHKICPNVKKLVVCGQRPGKNLKVTMSLVFKILKKIQKLEIKLDCSPPNCPSLDAEITGMSMAACQLLRESKVSRDLFTNFEILRKNPSICDLKSLEYFGIEVKELRKTTKNKNGAQTRKSFLISQVSHFYAFQLMPNLTLSFHCGEKGGASTNLFYN